MQVTIAGETSLLIRKSIRRYMLEMLDNLGYESSTFVERMLIDEICLRWLKLQLTQHKHSSHTTGEHQMRQGLYWERRLELSQKGYLRSLATLAKVRKMIVQTQAKGAEMYSNLRTESARDISN